MDTEPTSLGQTRHASRLEKALMLLELHVDRRHEQMLADPEALLSANDRQILAQMLKVSHEEMEFEEAREHGGFLLPYDRRYTEIGQGICIGDVPGATQRVFSMAKNPPPGIRKYWWSFFDEQKPAVLNRLGKWKNPRQGHGLPPMDGESICPLPDNGEDYPEDLKNFTPDEYASGWMPIPGATHAMIHIAGRALYEVYCDEKGIDPESGKPLGQVSCEADDSS